MWSILSKSPIIVRHPTCVCCKQMRLSHFARYFSRQSLPAVSRLDQVSTVPTRKLSDSKGDDTISSEELILIKPLKDPDGIDLRETFEGKELDKSKSFELDKSKPI